LIIQTLDVELWLESYHRFLSVVLFMKIPLVYDSGGNFPLFLLWWVSWYVFQLCCCWANFI